MSKSLTGALEQIQSQVSRQLRTAVYVLGEVADDSGEKKVKLSGDNLPVIQMDSGQTLAYASKKALFDTNGHQHSYRCLTTSTIPVHKSLELMDALHEMWKENTAYLEQCPFRLGVEYSDVEVDELATLTNAIVVGSSGVTNAYGDEFISVSHGDDGQSYRLVLIGTDYNGHVYRLVDVN